MAVEIDSYSESNQGSFQASDSTTFILIGQSFTCGGSYTLDSAKFYLRKSGSPTGNIYTKLYSHSGTYGTSSVGDTLLATSDAYNIASLTTSYQLITFSFSGAEKVALSPGYYVMTVGYAGGNGSNYLMVGTDSSSSAHDGNLCRYFSSWAALSTWDACFYVYGEVAGSAGKYLTLLGVG